MLAAGGWTVDSIREEVVKMVEAEEKTKSKEQDKGNSFNFDSNDPEGAASEPDDPKKDGRFINGFDSAYVLKCLSRNQIGDAELFQAIHRGKLLYDHAAGAWFRWVGHFWEQDKTESYITAVQAVCKVYESELMRMSWRANGARAKGEPPDKKSEGLEKALRARLTALQCKQRIMDVLTLARAGDELSTAGDCWDKNPMLLTCKNGIIDLTNGLLRAGSPIDMNKTSCPIEYQGLDAPRIVWDKFLIEIFDGNLELVSFVQRSLGYCCTGLVQEHVYPVWYGIGRNGKTTLCETIQQDVLGDYAGVMAIETVMQQRTDSAPGGARSDLMALQSKRFMTASESEEGRKLNVSRIKTLTGGDCISARAVFGKHQITFAPTHKMILLTNFKPKIPADDFAAWQRILLIPFDLRFVDEPKGPKDRLKDGAIRTKLQKELPGILAWLVEGALEWQRIGLKPPESVKVATDAYHSENDSLGDFIRDCCKLTGETQSKILFDAYSEFCQESGLNPLNGNKFSSQMDMRFDKYPAKRKQFYIGISLVDG